MKTFLARLKNKASVLYYTAGAKVTVYAQTEPVRLRSRVLAAVAAAGVLIPALATQRADEVVTGIVVPLLTIGAGEAMRAKVTPADEK